MSTSFLSFIIWLALSLSHVTANPSLGSSVRVRAPPGASEKSVIQAVRREIGVAALHRRSQNYSVSTTLDKSWDNAVLLKFGAEQQFGNGSSSLSVNENVEIVCTTCYIKGVAKGELTIMEHVNVSQIVNQTIEEVKGDVENLTTEAEDYFKTYLHNVATNFEGDGFHLSDFALPTFNHSFDLSISTIPEVTLHFEFDGMELYMLLDTSLSLGATYTLNLYASKSELGIQVTKDMFVGIIFTVDLILDLDGMIDISSGFHIKVDDGLAIDIALFGDDVSGITFNGAHFEFLPVAIESAGVVFTATLRIGIHAGFSVSSPSSDFEILNSTIPSVSGGVEVGVFANIAKFTTNVTVQPENQECDLGVVQSYQFDLGAAAGATIAIDTHTWGPVPQTTVPVWYTELGAACVSKRTTKTSAMPNITATPLAAKRQDLTTTTITTEVTYTGVSCISTGIINCPASLQNTSQSTSTATLVTAVPSGTDDDDIAFPASIHITVPTTVSFGTKTVSMSATAGSPVSYIPPPPPPTANPTTGIGPMLHGEVKGVDKRVIIGVTVGVGVPVLLALAAAIFFVQKRRRYAAVPGNEVVSTVGYPYGNGGQATDGHDLDDGKAGKTGVTITEVQRRGS